MIAESLLVSRRLVTQLLARLQAVRLRFNDSTRHRLGHFGDGVLSVSSACNCYRSLILMQHSHIQLLRLVTPVCCSVASSPILFITSPLHQIRDNPKEVRQRPTTDICICRITERTASPPSCCSPAVGRASRGPNGRDWA